MESPIITRNATRHQDASYSDCCVAHHVSTSTMHCTVRAGVQQDLGSLKGLNAEGAWLLLLCNASENYQCRGLCPCYPVAGRGWGLEGGCPTPVNLGRCLYFKIDSLGAVALRLHRNSFPHFLSTETSVRMGTIGKGAGLFFKGGLGLALAVFPGVDEVLRNLVLRLPSGLHVVLPSAQKCQAMNKHSIGVLAHNVPRGLQSLEIIPLQNFLLTFCTHDQQLIVCQAAQSFPGRLPEFLCMRHPCHEKGVLTADRCTRQRLQHLWMAPAI